MKTKEELNALKEEVETVSRKLHELTEEELAQVSGGGGSSPCLVIGPYWGNAMRTEGPYNAILYQSGVTAEYVNTPGVNCKFRLSLNGCPVGWADQGSLQM